jgi:NADH:ubiquinone oxidoreductase subunit 3 (subunit A)
MWPFKNKNIQRGVSIFLIIIGILIMIITPLSNIINNLGLNAFITGLIIAFVGFFYFMDIQ